MKEILDFINQILCENFHKESHVELEDKLNDCIDSLEFIQLIVEVEKKFSIIFPVEKLDNKEFETVEKLIMYIQLLM